MNQETIVALVTAPVKSAVAVVRVSGPLVRAIAEAILGQLPKPRHAFYGLFYAENLMAIDNGLALFFPNPHSFTGEDVLELHCHGSLIVIELLLKRIINLGARLARPGEFSETAFLNGKIDLTQAEAIADLIDSQSIQAARCALRSLQGDFSKQVNIIVKDVIHIRTYIEAAIDFVDEEIDFLNDYQVESKIKNIADQIKLLLTEAEKGAVLKNGFTIAIAGKPNVGKSSLLNQLAKKEVAIVTHIPGTTRDVMRETILIEGIPINFFDTAGIRETEDIVEQEGIRRAKKELQNADHILVMSESEDENPLENISLPENISYTMIKNKIDLTEKKSQIKNNLIYLSAKTGEGIDLLLQYLKNITKINQLEETTFSARTRHIEALKKALNYIVSAQKQTASELMAEDLRQAQLALDEITGKFTHDDLLGEIFSQFCIGK